MSDLTATVPTANGERFAQLHKRALAEHIPLAGGIELTHRCNLACIHCYVNLPANDRSAAQRELTTDEWCRVLDQMADAGVLWLTITGGEPMLRPDFADIWRHAHAKGFVLSLYTNATLVTERHIELLAAHPPRMLEVTQYGYTRETYDRVVDAGEQYDRFTRGLERLRAAGVPITLKAIGMKASKDELHDIRRYAEREGLKFRFDAVLSPRIDGGRKPLEQRLSPAELAELEAGDEARQRVLADYCTPRFGTPKTDHRYQCGAGILTFLVDPYGKMHVCELSRKPGWNVLRDGFADGFRVAFPQLLSARREHSDGCGSCGASVNCSNCTGMAELEGLDPDGGNPYLCNVTDARNQRMFGAAAPVPNGLVKLRLQGEHGKRVE